MQKKKSSQRWEHGFELQSSAQSWKYGQFFMVRGEAEGSLGLCFYHFLRLLEGKKLQQKEQNFAIKMITALEIHLENFLWILYHCTGAIFILVDSSSKYMKLK